ncbi:MAG: hypothetical protein R6V85_14390, partial [Polyangia bacterium]
MIRVGLGLAGAGDDLVYIDVGEASGEGWSEAVLPLSAWSGQTLSLLALEFESDQQTSGFQGRIGEMALLQGGVDVPAAP